jgi:NADH-ubiquinone oxidoreductase chain 5
MPYYLKTTALIVTILGFILALEISNITKNLKYHYPSNAFKFSTLLGYFPTIIHRLAPYINLSISQKSASSLLDLI